MPNSRHGILNWYDCVSFILQSQNSLIILIFLSQSDKEWTKWNRGSIICISFIQSTGQLDWGSVFIVQACKNGHKDSFIQFSPTFNTSEYECTT